jgi:hypothetical protein
MHVASVLVFGVFNIALGAYLVKRAARSKPGVGETDIGSDNHGGDDGDPPGAKAKVPAIL